MPSAIERMQPARVSSWPVLSESRAARKPATTVRILTTVSKMFDPFKREMRKVQFKRERWNYGRTKVLKLPKFSI